MSSPKRTTKTPTPGRCAAITRSGHPCTNRASIGPVCLTHEQYDDGLPDGIRQAVRRARKRRLAKWLRQRASNPPILSRDELDILVDHAERGAAAADLYAATRGPYLDDVALDAQRRGLIRDAIVSALERVEGARRERAGSGLRLVRR